jgi:hypothetical protein
LIYGKNIKYHYIFVSGYGSFQKRSTIPPRRKFLPSGEGGEKKLFVIIVNVFRTSEGGRGVNFQFPPCGWYGCFLE